MSEGLFDTCKAQSIGTNWFNKKQLLSMSLRKCWVLYREPDLII